MHLQDFTPALPSDEYAATFLPRILFEIDGETGLDFSSYKFATLLRRIERRAFFHHLPTLDASWHYLRDHPAEVGLLVQDLFIPVTRFFRNPPVFDLLAREIFPACAFRQLSQCVNLLPKRDAITWSNGKPGRQYAVVFQLCSP